MLRDVLGLGSPEKSETSAFGSNQGRYVDTVSSVLASRAPRNQRVTASKTSTFGNKAYFTTTFHGDISDTTHVDEWKETRRRN
jgi:hypothetical protein